eukprot:Skav225530  [mRNA]  locus=scaffold144:424189:427039:- [translate_table: standard]
MGAVKTFTLKMKLAKKIKQNRLQQVPTPLALLGAAWHHRVPMDAFLISFVDDLHQQGNATASVRAERSPRNEGHFRRRFVGWNSEKVVFMTAAPFSAALLVD